MREGIIFKGGQVNRRLIGKNVISKGERDKVTNGTQ